MTEKTLMPCYKYIVRRITTEEEKLEFAKAFISQYISNGLAHDDVMVRYCATASYRTNKNLNMLSYNGTVLSKEEFLQAVSIDAHIKRYKSCQAYAKHVGTDIAPCCRLCELSPTYCNDCLQYEYRAIKYINHSIDNLNYFTSIANQSFFRSVIDLNDRSAAAAAPVIISLLRECYLQIKQKGVNYFSVGIDGSRMSDGDRLKSLMPTILPQMIDSNPRMVHALSNIMVENVLMSDNLKQDELNNIAGAIDIKYNHRLPVHKKDTVSAEPTEPASEPVSAEPSEQAASKESPEETVMVQPAQVSPKPVEPKPDQPKPIVSVHPPVAENVQTPSAVSAPDYCLGDDISDSMIEDGLRTIYGAYSPIISADEIPIDFNEDIAILPDDDDYDLTVKFADIILCHPESWKSDSGTATGIQSDVVPVDEPVPAKSIVAEPTTPESVSPAAKPVDINTDTGCETSDVNENTAKDAPDITAGDTVIDPLVAHPIEANTIYLPAVTMQMLKSYLHPVEGSENDIASAVMLDKDLPIEIMADHGTYYAVIWVRKLRRYYYCALSAMPSGLSELLSHQSIRKICYQPYYLYSLCRIKGVRLRNVYSLYSMHMLLIGHDVTMSYREIIELYTSGKNFEPVSFGVPVVDEILGGLPNYRVCRAEQEVLTLRLSKDSQLAAQLQPYKDEVLGTSFLRAANFEDAGTLFDIDGEGVLTFNENFDRRVMKAGFLLTYNIDDPELDNINKNAIFMAALIDLAVKGRVRKLDIQLMTICDGHMILYIASDHYQLISTLIQVFFNQYALKHGMEKFGLVVAHEKVVPSCDVMPQEKNLDVKTVDDLENRAESDKTVNVTVHTEPQKDIEPKKNVARKSFTSTGNGTMEL
jgi:hypothetical protein